MWNHRLKTPIILSALLAAAVITACGKRAPLQVADPASISTIKKGKTNCSRTSCDKLKLDLQVAVPPPGLYAAGSRTITIPAESSTEIRFSAKVAVEGVTRQAALLVKENPAVPAWLTKEGVSAGSITLKAAPPAGSQGGMIAFQIRDITYCSATSATPENCRSPSIAVDSDETITFTISVAPPGMQSNGVYVLPSETLCVKPPSQMEQTVSTLQQGVSVVSSVLSGNFIPVITNMTSNVISSQTATPSNKREGC